MSTKSKLFLIHCVFGFTLFYLLIKTYRLTLVFLINTLTGSHYEYSLVFNGLAESPTISHGIEDYILNPILETLIFQVFIFAFLKKLTQSNLLIILFSSALFFWLHALYQGVLGGLGAGIVGIAMTQLYILNHGKIGMHLSAAATIIAHALLNIALSYY